MTTDIGGTDPDDEQSMVHLLMMSNDIDIEGIICQMAFCVSPIGIDNLNKIIDAYDKAVINLKKHDSRYPSADYFRSIATTGQTEVGMSGVGENKDTDGSELIFNSVLKDDPRPIWLTAWGGMNTIAQAIWKAKHTLSDNDFDLFINKIRIYDILGQCDAGAWIAHNFPEIKYIRACDVYNWAPDDIWTRDYIQAYSPMGDVYPTRKWATEGDSPSFLYLVNNGLNVPEIVNAGGWGGLFSDQKIEGIRGMDWVERNNLDEKQFDPYLMYTNPIGQHTMQRWSDAIRNDFATRIQWSCNSDFESVNHHPVILFEQELTPTKQPIYLKAKAGDEIVLNIKDSYDPDNDKLIFNTYYYQEASTYKGIIDITHENGIINLTIPNDIANDTLHFVIEATDDGFPKLTTYRRIIIST